MSIPYNITQLLLLIIALYIDQSQFTNQTVFKLLISMSLDNAKPIVAKPMPASQNTLSKVSVFSLYKFCGFPEKTLLILGILTAAANGAALPMMCVVVGSAINGFSPKNTVDEVLDKVARQSLWMIYIGAISFVLGIVAEASWIALGERLGIKVRGLYLDAIMRKEVAWFDANHPQELPTKITSLVTRYQAGIGDKVGKVVISLSMFISGITVSFIYGWQLALALLGIYPMTVLVARYASTANLKGAEKLRQGYALCGGYAEEAFAAVKTVYAFCAEKFEKNKYLRELGNAERSAVKSSIYLGASVGLINMAISLSQGLGFLIGSYFIEFEVYNSTYKGSYTAASVMTVFFSGLFAMFSLGMIAPQLKSIEEAQIAAREIYGVIVSIPEAPQDVMVEGVKIPADKLKGRIEFKNVTFAYPAKPDVKVLKNFSMVFEPGRTTGICGETGSGKSTIIQLLERFYKPTSGSIEVDGYDISTLDLQWWRNTIGYVGQEPVLFNTTIKENIRYGKPDASDSEIIEAAAKANAAEFIERFPQKINTETGAGGGQLSGGQKQRIAIARALVKKPKILLLDEATSALDGVSERKVQDAILGLQQGKNITAIVVAHRLTTIKSASKIVVISKGEVAEVGNDKDLRLINGIYRKLCKLQEGEDEASEHEMEIKIEETTAKPAVENRPSDSTVQTTERRFSTAETRVEERRAPKAKKIDRKKYTAKIWAENWKYKYHLIFAIILAIISGYNMPVSGTLFGMVSMDLLLPDKEELRRKVNLDFIGFTVNGIVILGIAIVMFWLFGYIAAKVTYNLRERLYSHILTMDIGWFDLPGNMPFVLGSILGEGAENINGVVKMIASSMIQSISSLIIALGIGFAYSYKMAAIVLGCVPIVAISGAVQTKFQIKFAQEKEELYKKSMEILSEAVRNFRTVASFSNERRTSEMYKTSLVKPLKQGQKAAIVSGVLFGVSQLLPFLIYSQLFYLAALFLVKYNDNPRDTFITVYALLFSAMALGQIQQYAPDMGKAYASLHAVYGIIEQKPKIASPANPVNNTINGRIEFQNVSFRYPTRSDFVLQNLNLTIQPGQRVTIVGASGSGKSTIIQLLERFYDVAEGRILLDGVDIRKYNLGVLRKSMGYVPQEPYLFDSTIEENVKYGTPEADLEEIKEACRIAGALEFIERENSNTSPQLVTENQFCLSEADKGFNRKVGTRGSLLSGGQKQRLAIARAILKKPQILLLDEATSALDSETEAEVQRAVAQAAEGRTAVSVAHRLGAVGEDDIILVLENGKIVEEGKKEELMEKKGCFYKLYAGVSVVEEPQTEKQVSLCIIFIQFFTCVQYCYIALLIHDDMQYQDKQSIILLQYQEIANIKYIQNHITLYDMRYTYYYQILLSNNIRPTEQRVIKDIHAIPQKYLKEYDFQLFHDYIWQRHPLQVPYRARNHKECCCWNFL
eukprot:TRINITY_DN120914_c2_g1_i1.p1 TRINITY_DN120914_c2_g1~~TRINITY_DN120914_c2_g1_i1.p1  ORF type:complete len:1441 (+),score=125.37 TRINITY_DN120914_c2_g1_i1:280-4602(+)